MAIKSRKDRPRRIEIRGDVLVLDEDFCKEVLADASQRTAKRHEAEGLPFVMVAGCKYRPLNAGREWLASRIVNPNQPQKPRRAA
jgi:hypothetical protein